jgi:hypothetical protein
MESLTNFFAKLSLNDKEIDMDALAQLMSEISISGDEIKSITVDDNKLIIHTKNNEIFRFTMFTENQCKNEYNLIHGNYISRWGDAY